MAVSGRRLILAKVPVDRKLKCTFLQDAKAFLDELV